jgi:hypothetical protein
MYLIRIHYSDKVGNWCFPWMGHQCKKKEDAMAQANDKGRKLLQQGATCVKAELSLNGIIIGTYYPNCMFE